VVGAEIQHLVAGHALRGTGRDRAAQDHLDQARTLLTDTGADPADHTHALDLK
jgi:hypothetical protein